MPPQDPQKIQTKLDELNAEGNEGAPHWVAAEGLRALTNFLREDSKITFESNVGTPVKMFVNRLSGEVKIYDAVTFSVDK